MKLGVYLTLSGRLAVLEKAKDRSTCLQYFRDVDFDDTRETDTWRDEMIAHAPLNLIWREDKEAKNELFLDYSDAKFTMSGWEYLGRL